MPINFPTVADSDNEDGAAIVVDRVNDPIVARTEPE
jgi:hypothetical protein